MFILFAQPLDVLNEIIASYIDYVNSTHVCLIFYQGPTFVG